MRKSFSAVFFLCICSCLLLTACGKKAWPEPVEAHDRFAITQVQAKRYGNCLQVSISVDTNADNIQTLFLETAPDDCPGCPVLDPVRTEFSSPDPDLIRNGTTLMLTACSLTPGTEYRWRVILTNSYRGLAPVATPWHSTAQTITP